MNNERLKAAYCEILKDIDPKYLGTPVGRPGGLQGLSGLFLPSVSDEYSEVKNRIMIVGRETRGWEPLPTNTEFDSVDAYVEIAMAKHKKFFQEQLAGRNTRGRSFHNFTRAVAKVVPADSLIYSNLFCFAWGKTKGSPAKSGKDVFPVVKEFSKKILDAQIEILQPTHIVFANGVASASYRREFFSHREGGRCTMPVSYPERAGVEHFWEFMLDGKIRCFRICHPSARASPGAKKGQNFALELLGNAAR